MKAKLSKRYSLLWISILFPITWDWRLPFHHKSKLIEVKNVCIFYIWMNLFEALKLFFQRLWPRSLHLQYWNEAIHTFSLKCKQLKIIIKTYTSRIKTLFTIWACTLCYRKRKFGLKGMVKIDNFQLHFQTTSYLVTVIRICSFRLY